MERLSCLQSIHGVEDSLYPHVLTDAALPEAIDVELEASFPEAQILDRVQQMDGGSPTRRLKTPEALASSDLPLFGRTFCAFTPVPSLCRQWCVCSSPSCCAVLGHLVCSDC